MINDRLRRKKIMSTLLSTHITLAVISVSGFVIREVLHLKRSLWLKTRLVRIVPHAVDTLLLVSGITLAYWLAQHHASLRWLWPKLLLVVAYISFGFICFRFSRSKATNLLAFFCAILCVVLIVWIAVLKPEFHLGL